MSRRFIQLAYLVHFEINRDRRGLLSPTQGQHYQQQSGQITLRCVMINKPMFSKANSHEETSKNRCPEVHGCGGLKLVKLAREPPYRHSALTPGNFRFEKIYLQLALISWIVNCSSTPEIIYNSLQVLARSRVQMSNRRRQYNCVTCFTPGKKSY